MTPKSLFIIILRILGIFFIKDIVEAFPSILSGIQFIGNDSNPDGGILVLLYGAIIFLIYLLISWILIFKAEAIVNRFKLNKGFEEERFSFDVSPHAILMVAVIATGLFILIVEIPNFCQHLYSYFQYREIAALRTNQFISYIIFTAVKIILALLLIGERKRIVAFMLRKQVKEAVE